jgi:hypothetical protein
MAPPTLDSLPEELIEVIVRVLADPSSIGALRVSNRSISGKCSRGLFTTFFRRKQIEVSEDAFRDALPVLTTFGSFVEELTILVPFRDLASRVDWAQERQRIESLQAQCFAAIRSASTSNSERRPTLVLDIASDGYPRFSQQRFANIVESARITLRALQTSRENFGMLDFGRCSIPMNAFEEGLGSEIAPPILESVRHLSLSISHRYKAKHIGHGTDIDASEEYNPEDSKEHIQTVCRALEGAKSLNNLDLHWYDLRCPKSRHFTGMKRVSRRGTPQDLQDLDVLMQKYEHERRHFNHRLLSPLAALQQLRSCTLRGLFTTAPLLCAFLASTSARQIMLQSVYLNEQEEGSWTTVFDILTRASDPFEEISLDDLFVSIAIHRLPIYLNGPGAPKFPVLRGNHGLDAWPSDLHRSGEEVSRPLRWKFVGGRALAGSSYWNWNQRRKEQFGPPDDMQETLPLIPADAQLNDMLTRSYTAGEELGMRSLVLEPIAS